VANIIDVVVTEKETSTEVIDPFHGGDAEALDAPQEILEGYQIPETKVPFISRTLAFFLLRERSGRIIISIIPRSFRELR